MTFGQLEPESETYPEGDPGIAFELMRDRLMYQRMAVDGLDSKLAVVLGTSGLVLTVVSAFLALREEKLTAGEIRFVIAEVVLFVFVTLAAVSGIVPRAWKGVTWEQIVERSTSGWKAEGIKWSIAKGLKGAGDANQFGLELKVWLLRVTLAVLVAQILLATIGMILTVS